MIFWGPRWLVDLTLTDRSSSLVKRCLGTASCISLSVAFGGVKCLFNLHDSVSKLVVYTTPSRTAIVLSHCSPCFIFRSIAEEHHVEIGYASSTSPDIYMTHWYVQSEFGKYLNHSLLLIQSLVSVFEVV